MILLLVVIRFALYLAVLAKKKVYTSVPKGHFCKHTFKKNNLFKSIIMIEKFENLYMKLLTDINYLLEKNR
jgi:hypothetical protein